MFGPLQGAQPITLADNLDGTSRAGYQKEGGDFHTAHRLFFPLTGVSEIGKDSANIFQFYRKQQTNRSRSLKVFVTHNQTHQ